MLGRIDKLDLTKPGAVEDLLAFHRALFGGARMEGNEGGSGGQGAGGDGGSGGQGGTGSGGDEGKSGGQKTGTAGGSGKRDEPDEGEALAAQFAEARTGRKAAERAISELTGKTVTQVRKAFKDAGGDPVKAVEALTGSAGKGGSGGKAGDGGKEGEQVDAEKIRADARREAEEAAAARIVRAEVRALAAETFANPADALHNLDLDDYEVDDDGELVDPNKVKTDLAAVLKKYPHYAKATKTGAKPDRSQGAGGAGTGDRPKSMRELSRLRVDD